MYNPLTMCAHHGNRRAKMRAIAVAVLLGLVSLACKESKPKVEISATTPVSTLNELERQRVDLERQKMKWSAIALGIPLLVAAVSFAATVVGQARQARAQFQLKAAELVINTDDPFMAESRARALLELFPDQMGPTFGERFAGDNYMGTNFNDRIKIAAQVIEHPEKRDEILRTYLRVFENDAWL
jgi:hypothetical protein